MSNTSPLSRPVRRRGFVDSTIRSAVISKLDDLSDGVLTLVEGDEVRHFGTPADDGLRAVVHVENPRLFRRLTFGGALGAAESYLDGDWTTDDLTSVIRVFARNLPASSTLERGPARLWQWASRVGHRLSRNSRSGSRRNIAAHYDLGNDFFETFLDPSMAYSCGLFETAGSTLLDASTAKFERICRTLHLQESDHVIEIGCGWGGFAIHAATRYGCRVTATTISSNQFEVARQRVHDAGLSHRVTILFQDYRDLAGKFDKLVSIEMIEAVGHEFLSTYLQTCSRLLHQEGLALIQGITIPDQLYDSYRHSVDFIQKHIFPGGCLVSVAHMADCLARSTDLNLVALASFPEHYARTLALWRERFTARLDDVRALGYDETFIRAWLYYLSYCEAGFLERQIGLSHFTLAKPRAR